MATLYTSILAKRNQMPELNQIAFANVALSSA